MKYLIVKSFITTLFLSQLAFAQNEDMQSVATQDSVARSKSSASSAKQESQEYERIQVTGQLPTSYYRTMLHKAEDNFFDMFNALSEKEEFQVTCERKANHGFTRLKKRVCEAKFVSMIDADDIESSQRLQSSRRSLVTNKLSRTKKYKEMAKKQATYMAKLINSNEKLRLEYLKLADAKQKFENSKNQG